MATASPLHVEGRSRIRGIDWVGYLMICDAIGDGGPRMAYFRGDLEIMSPVSMPDEEAKVFLDFLIEAVADHLDLWLRSVGSTTLRRADADCALEPDCAYYLSEPGRRLVGTKYPDLAVDPPPDLAVEVERTNPLIDKLAAYAAIGVPEIWWHLRGALKVLLLQADGTYGESSASRAFPTLPVAEAARLAAAHDPMSHRSWRRELRAWVRDAVGPAE